MSHNYECTKHKWPEPGYTGMELRCPSCAVSNVVKRNRRPLTIKQRQRLAATNAPRIDDISGHAWAKIRERIRNRDQYTCLSCKRVDLHGVVDHIKPLEKGGSDDDANLQYLCSECHRKKTAIDRGYVKRDGSNLDGTPKGLDHHWNK